MRSKGKIVNDEPETHALSQKRKNPVSPAEEYGLNPGGLGTVGPLQCSQIHVLR